MDKQRIASLIAGKTGLNRFLLKRVKEGPPQLIVLVFHRLVEDSASDHPYDCDHLSKITLKFSTFKRQINWISDHFPILSLDEILEGVSLKKTSVLITFDDGYKELVQLALPVLEHLGVVATVFVTGPHIKKQQPSWIQQLHWMMEHRVGNFFQVTEQGQKYDLSNHKDYVCCLGEFKRRILNEASPESFEVQLRRLKADLFPGQEGVLGQEVLLTATDIDLLTEKGWTFGCHSNSHLSLNQLKLEALEKDISVAADSVGALKGYRPVFALPFGLENNYNIEVLEAISNKGFKKIFTCQGLPNPDVGQSVLLHRVISETPHFNYFKFVALNGKGLLAPLKRK